MKTVTRDALAELLRKEGNEILTAGNEQEPIERLTEVSDRCLTLLLNLRGSGIMLSGTLRGSLLILHNQRLCRGSVLGMFNSS